MGRRHLKKKRSSTNGRTLGYFEGGSWCTPRISMVHLPEEGRSGVLPKRLGSESSLVYSKLLAASPAVFTRIRVVCEPRCQTSVPEILNLLAPNSCRPPPGRREGTGSGRSLQRATPLTPPLSPPLSQEFLGRADGPPPLPPPSPSWSE